MPLTLAILLLLTLLLMAAAAARAQESGGGAWDIPRAGGENIIEPSPEATAMRRYCDVPVSYANGSVDISIPLVDLPGGTTGISLALSYQTGGIKRQDLQSAVGLGWNLTGLGSVSRQINGFPDEWRGGNFQPVRFNMKDLPYDIDYLRSIIECETETEYDRYSYNIPGYAGSFMIVGDSIVQLPQTELRITRTPSASNPLATESFTIATPEGLVYELAEQEHTSYSYIQRPTVAWQYDHSYDGAITTWHLTRVGDTETLDSATFTYYPMQAWVRNNNVALTTYSYLMKTDMSLHDPRSESVAQDGSTNQTVFYDQRLPFEITTRSGKIRFDLSMCHDGIRHEMPTDYIRSVSLYDNGNNLIRKVSFDNSQAFSDGRRMLREITATSDGAVVDKYSFTYIDNTAADGYDLFGFPNGQTLGSTESYSVLDSRLEFSAKRRPNSFMTSNNSLSSFTDISGITTRLNYEGSVVPVSAGLLKGDVQIGTRIGSITTFDTITGRSRTRAFTYENPVCNINLGLLTYADFISQSGVHYTDSYAQTYNYSLGVPYLASSRTRGYPVEQARIYYGKVTETVSGTNIDKPVRTVYEYDLSKLQCPFITSEWHGTHTNTRLGIRAEDGKNLGNLDNKFIGQSVKDHKLLRLNTTRGYFMEQVGASPLLTRKTSFEWSGNDYQKRQTDEYTYLGKESEQIRTGIFCESVVFKFYDKWTSVETDLNVTDLNDVFYFVTYLKARSDHQATHTVTHFYPDGNSRSVTTSYTYRGGSPVPERLPGFCTDSLRATVSFSPVPVATKTSSGQESVTAYTARSENAVTSTILKAAVSHGFRHLPVAEKWVLETSQGKDSLLRHYTYRQFESGGGNPLTRPCEVSVSAGNALISQQSYTGYDFRGRITGMTDAQGRRITASWLPDYDALSALSLPDVGLTTTYTHRPLVGCTSITAPSGKVRRFDYTAGRLAAERNTAGNPVASYSYRLYGDGSASGTDRRNIFTSTIIDDTDTATTAVYYDGFGLPVQTVANVAGGSLVRSVTEYDALDRAVCSYLPVPAASVSYDPQPAATAMAHYGDTRPYAETRYRAMAGDMPLDVIGEGQALQQHPRRFDYLCNNTADPLLQCRRYRLADSAGSETVTLDGLYPAGALDVTSSTDPDSCRLLTFTDWRGLTILERRVLSDTLFADTYFLYDVFGNPRVVIQPEGAALMTADGTSWTTDSDPLQQYAFISRYDRRGNLVCSKTPGAGPVEMRYDPLNRLAFRATDDLMDEGGCEFFLYDPAGRPAVTGMNYHAYNCFTDTLLMTVSYKQGCGGIDKSDYSGSDNLNRLLKNDDATVVNYYDSYDCLSDPVMSSLQGFLSPIDTAKAPGNLVATRIGVYDGSKGYRSLSDAASSIHTLYSLDSEDRIIGQAETSAVPGWKTVQNYTYTRQGHRLTSDYSVITADSIRTAGSYISYDAIGNPITRTDRFSAGTHDSLPAVGQWQTDYAYNTSGQLEKATNSCFSTEYAYNLRGQLTGINTPAFSQTLKYEDGATPCYNGNISEMTVMYSGNNPVTRKYYYDSLDRLMAMDSDDGCSTAYTYNLNSSPLTVMRRGLTSAGTVGVVDSLRMYYTGNLLTRVDDIADPVSLENSLDFKGPSRTYGYDYDGRLYSNGTIYWTRYTPAGNPLVLGGDQSRLRATYRYSATGTKLSSAVAETLYTSPTATRYYIGPMEFMQTASDTEPRLDRVNLPWGYMGADGLAHAYVNDHQGNIRAVIGHNGAIEQTTDYYPYGLPMATSTGAKVNRYKYGGKEFETGLGLNYHDFEARMLFNDRTLFNRPDPQAAKYPHLNPYLYCAANPLRYTDPTGEDVTISIKNDTIIVTANIILHGDGATDSMVESCKESFDNTWGKISEYEKDGVKYHVKWKITIRKQQSGDAVPDKSNGVDNYMRVDTNNPHLRSRVYESRYGTFYKSKYKKLSTRTFAHEFGHMLGLKDRYSDIGGKSISHDGWHGNIMAAGKELNIDQRNLDAIFLKATHKQNWLDNKPNSTSKNPAYRTEELFNLLNQNIIIINSRNRER